MTDAEVWQRLDFTAGRPSSRTQALLTRALMASMIIALVVVALFSAGVLGARVAWGGAGSGGGSEPGRYYYEVPVENQGLVPVTIVGIGQSLPGLELEPPPAGLFPLRLPPGEHVSLTVTYRVTSCASFSQLRTLPVQIERWWGTQTGQVAFPSESLLPCQAVADQG